jgi:hypothetical protein
VLGPEDADEMARHPGDAVDGTAKVMRDCGVVTEHGHALAADWFRIADEFLDAEEDVLFFHG